MRQQTGMTTELWPSKMFWSEEGTTNWCRIQ